MAYSIDEIRKHLTSYRTARSDALTDHVALYEMVETLLGELDANGESILEAQVTALQDENDALSRDRDTLAAQLAEIEVAAKAPATVK